MLIETGGVNRERWLMQKGRKLNAQCLWAGSVSPFCKIQPNKETTIDVGKVFSAKISRRILHAGSDSWLSPSEALEFRAKCFCGSPVCLPAVPRLFAQFLGFVCIPRLFWVFLARSNPYINGIPLRLHVWIPLWDNLHSRWPPAHEELTTKKAKALEPSETNSGLRKIARKATNSSNSILNDKRGLRVG